MGTFEPSQKKSSHTASSPIATSLFRSRSSPKPSATVEEASTNTPDFQARWDFARSHAPNLNSLAANSSGDRAPSTIQPKLTVGAPNDQYEQEADRVADQVMSMPDAATPQTVQREAMPEEVQMKPSLQQSLDGSLQAGEGMESRLNQSKGGGSPLSDEVRSFMEPRFGADFSSVQVHTSSTAVQMNQELGAQAFTHGSDIYFGNGKSPANSDLTAHELTHVIQQTGDIQAKENSEGVIQRDETEEEQVYTPANANISTLEGTEAHVDSSDTPANIDFDALSKPQLTTGDPATSAGVDMAKRGATEMGVLQKIANYATSQQNLVPTEDDTLVAKESSLLGKGSAMETTLGVAGIGLNVAGNIAAGQNPDEAIFGAEGRYLASKALPKPDLGSVAIGAADAGLKLAGAPQGVTDVSSLIADSTYSSFGGAVASNLARGTVNAIKGDKKASDQQFQDVTEGKSGAALQGYALLPQVAAGVASGQDLDSAVLKVGSQGQNSPVARVGSWLGSQAYQVINKDLPEASEFAKKDLKSLWNRITR